MHDPAQYAPLSAQFSAQPHIVGSDDALIFGAAAANIVRAKRPVTLLQTSREKLINYTTLHSTSNPSIAPPEKVIGDWSALESPHHGRIRSTMRMFSPAIAVKFFHYIGLPGHFCGCRAPRSNQIARYGTSIWTLHSNQERHEQLFARLTTTPMDNSGSCIGPSGLWSPVMLLLRQRNLSSNIQRNRFAGTSLLESGTIYFYSNPKTFFHSVIDQTKEGKEASASCHT